jgi:competence protein ComEA
MAAGPTATAARLEHQQATLPESLAANAACGCAACSVATDCAGTISLTAPDRQVVDELSRAAIDHQVTNSPNEVEEVMRTHLASALALGTLLIIGSPVIAASAQAPAPVAEKATINLNAATLDQLETLPGIGRKVAERILEYRTKSGGFKKIEELMNVKGIGEKSFLKIKPLISIPKPDKASGGD